MSDVDLMEGADLPFDIVELIACPGHANDNVPVHRLREVAFRADSWLPDEIVSLRTMFHADESFEAMAKNLGRTLSAVQTKVYEIGLRRNSSRPWTELEDEYLANEYGVVASATIAAMLGRTVAAIYAHALSLGLSEIMAPPWSPWEDAQLAAGFRDGIPVMQLAALIGRPLSGAVSRAASLGLRHASWNPTWTAEEKALAAKLAEQGLSAREIGLAFEQHGLRNRTKDGVSGMLKALGFERSWGRPWLAEEEAALRRVYADGGSIAQLSVRLGRSRSSLTWKSGELQLTGTHPNSGRGFRQGADWPEHELQLLRDRYGVEKVKNIAQALNRPLSGVYNMAHRLGLDSNYHRNWSREDDIAIGLAYSAGISMTDLALALNRAIAPVSKRALALNLSFQSRTTKAPKTRRAKAPAISLADILALKDQPQHSWVDSLVSPTMKRRGRAAQSHVKSVPRPAETIQVNKVPLSH